MLRNTAFCFLGIAVALMTAGYGAEPQAKESTGEEDTLVINDEVFKKADILKGAKECCTYAPGV
jgi:hypothetical protein